MGTAPAATMPPLPDQLWTDIALRIGLIVLVSITAFALVRLGIGVGLRHLLERRGGEVASGNLTAPERERRVGTIGRLAVRVAATVIGLIATLMVLGLFEINVGPALAGLGVVGIAVGFGAQSLVRDWFAGIFIVLEAQYSQGDVVRISGVEGVVQDFSLRRTTLRDLDGTIHTVPNGQITVASNLTRLWTPMQIDVRLADRGDTARAGEVANRSGGAMKADSAWNALLLDAPSVSRVAADGGAGGVLQVSGQVRSTDREAAEAELRQRVLAELKSAGIRAKT